MRLSDRLEAVTESRTAQFTSLLAGYAAKGVSIINMAVGEPDHETPLSVVAATKQALDDGKTRYSPVQGIKALRSRLSEQIEGYDEENIIVSNGSKQALYAIFQTICNPLDEVLVPRPYWVSFSEQVRLASAVPVFVDTVAHQLDCRAVSEAVTDRTRAIIINSPNNPTGAVYPFEALRKIADIAISRDLFIISDEAYCAFLYEDGLSERFFRYGRYPGQTYCGEEFFKNLWHDRLQGRLCGGTQGNHCSPGPASKPSDRQCLYLCPGRCPGGPFPGPFADGRELRTTQKAKRDLAYEYACRQFDCIKPAGGFYLFPDVSQHLKEGQTSEDFAAHLLEKGGVAVVPGEAFGMGGHIRISYAIPERELIAGFQRIASVL